MGLFFSKLMVLFDNWGSSHTRILMLGLDGAGKTSILYKIKLNDTINTIPTIGFHVETVNRVKGLTFAVWDLGGQDRIRTLWRHYYRNTEGLIYVVDSSDETRIAEAREELFGILDHNEMRDVPVMILANKQDLPDALYPAKMVKELCLAKLNGRKWFIQAASATTGEGIYEGLKELASMVKEYKEHR